MDSKTFKELYGEESITAWLVPVQVEGKLSHLPGPVGEVLLAENVVSFNGETYELTPLGLELLGEAA